MKRLQHSGFGDELRSLLRSPVAKDREVAGIIISEVEELERCIRAVKRHPKEYKLHDTEVSYLRLYTQGNSLRVYFMIERETLWMLALDSGKHQTKLSDSMKTRLRQRSREIKESIS